MHSLDHFVEPRIGTERIHHRIRKQIANGVSPIIGFLQPLESLVLFAECAVDGSDQVRGDVVFDPR